MLCALLLPRITPAQAEEYTARTGSVRVCAVRTQHVIHARTGRAEGRLLHDDVAQRDVGEADLRSRFGPPRMLSWAHLFNKYFS